VRAPVLRFSAVCEAPPPEGHRSKEAADHIARADRNELLVGIRPSLAGCGEGASARDRLGEAHERDARGRGPHVEHEPECRKRESGESARDVAHDADSVRRQP
jgi:hypothetical protein